MQNGVAAHYIVNTSKLDQRPLYELPALTLHEAVPGHHIQIALQQEAAGQPYFRRQANVTAFTEGWGLYAEYLGEEMGFYRTPYERFGACPTRCGAPVAWSRTPACTGWVGPRTRPAPVSATTRRLRPTTSRPNFSATSAGRVRPRPTRSARSACANSGAAERELGPKFNIRTFHDALLTEGPLPLALLDQRMDRWIAEQKAK